MREPPPAGDQAGGAPLAPGTRVGDYVIEHKLGGGGYSTVYAATHQGKDLRVAIKVVHQEPDEPSPQAQWVSHELGPVSLEVPLYNEFQVLSQLSCPGVRSAIDMTRHEGSHALVLQYVAGRSIQEIADDAFELDWLLRAAISTASVLAEIHASGVIHKDVNPKNILWDEAAQTCYLIDFGISARVDASVQYVQNPDRLEGTLAYISPEQTGRIHRVVDYRSDLYSFGATLYRLFTGDLPFSSEDPLELIYAHIAKQCPSASALDPRVPAAVARIIAKLMSKNPEDRYQSAIGVRLDLERCLQEWLAEQRISDFELGTHDIPVHFCIPHTLYGRQAEVDHILGCFRRVSEGQNALVLVAGFSGVGKTSVVKEVQRPITETKGFFAAGKFDQLARSTPYSAFIEALSELVAHILSESTRQFAVWRQRIREAVGELGQVLIDVVPSLELVIGPQPAVPELDPMRAQNRFNLVLRRFIRVLSQPEHPLVLFLDDLQWADRASLHLVEVLLTDEDSSHFLLIGAYRDNEVDDLHPLTKLRQELDRAQAEVHEITLRNLSPRDVVQLVADAMWREPHEVAALADLIHGKTHGNAFFTCRFLQSLYDEGLIHFCAADNCWRCEPAEVERKKVTDNVVDFMLEVMKAASAQTQDMLRLAACIGNRFRLSTLATVSETSPGDAIGALWEPIKTGLLIPLDDHYKVIERVAHDAEFRFSHDRVQQAAYALIDADERGPVHLTVGRLLLQDCPADELEAKVFQIVNHLNQARALIDAPDERMRLAELNLRAGLKAKSAAAYDSAGELFRSGVEMLPGECWRDHHQLSFDLHFHLAECVFLTGDFPRATELLDQVLRRCDSEVEKGRVYIQKIAQQTIQGMYFEAIHTGIHAFAELGIQLPPLDDDEAIERYLQRAREFYRDTWGQRPIDELIDLPITDDAVQELLRGILLNLLDCGLIAAPHYLPILGLTTVNLSLQHGNSNNSCYGYIAHGINTAAIEHDYAGAYEFGAVGLRLALEKFKDMRVKCKVLNGVGGFTHFYRGAMADTFDIMERGFTAGVEGGDFVHSSYCLVNVHRNFISAGVPLPIVAKKTGSYLDSFRKINAMVMHELCCGSSRAFLNYITGKTESSRSFDSDDFSVEEFVHKYQAVRLFAVFTNIYKLLGFYIMHEDDLALAVIEEFAADLRFADNYVHGEEYRFLTALVLLRTFSDSDDQAARWRRICELHAFVDKIAAAAPVNFRSHERLIAAEMARVERRPEGWQLYDEAIAAATESEQLHYAAMACECAARFWSEQGKPEFAELYRSRALHYYTVWGATRKVEAMQTARRPTSGKSEWTTTSLDTVTDKLQIDTSSLVGVLQAISGEVHQDKLVTVTMNLVMENAGAETATLLLPTAAGLRVAAHASGATGVQICYEPIDDSDAVCPEIVNYVSRSGHKVLLDRAGDNPEYSRLPHIRDNQVLSLLCLPLLVQGEMVGILYLENNLTANAFTEDRAALLTILAAQIAISLRNATFYEELERKVNERTKELRAAQQRLIELAYHDGMAEVAVTMLHNVGNLLNSLQVSTLLIHSKVGGMTGQRLEERCNWLRTRLEGTDIDEATVKFLDYCERLAQIYTTESQTIVSELDQQRAHLDRLGALVRAQQKHVRRSEAPEIVELREVVDEVLVLEADTLEAAGIEVVADYHTSARINAYGHKLRHMVHCIIQNAREALVAAPEGDRTMYITATQTDGRPCLEIRDTGCGIAQQDLRNIFADGFTTKPDRNGFSLHTCANFMAELGGQIRAHSDGSGRGTSIEMCFPAAP
ncbi:AAA family ATPase [Haliangium sp.]|uniref:ATP-binding sensor histidine kinase n=1 Tax=Haliangium sp. TaxID=2663208 RepID=UPI003D0E1909